MIVSGFHVYLNEVEEVLATLPGISECAVVSVPEEHSGEVVKVYIFKSDARLTGDQVRAHCKERLTNYKRPKYVEFIGELPKNTVGKKLRRELRDQPVI